MKQLRSGRHLVNRHLTKLWHRREKATIDHLVRSIDDAEVAPATPHSAFTASGLAIEEQVRKAWYPSPFGLAVF